MRKNIFKLLTVAAVIIVLMPSCASIVSKSSYPVSINSNPQGAELLVKDSKGVEVFRGVSPATVKLKASNKYMSGERYEVLFNLQGYAEQRAYIHSSLDGWFFGNILFGGLIGMLIVDPLTGAMYKLDDSPVNVTLVKDSSEKEVALNIVDIKDVPEDMRKNLIKIN